MIATERGDGSVERGWCRRRIARPLWLRGDLGPVEQPRIAIIGSRAPTASQLQVTTTFAQTAAALGWSIWSGGALGIDAAAHRAALHVGAITVAVLPAGYEPPTPPAHASLFAEIAERGALLALAPDGTQVRRGDFRTRNTVLAASVDALVVAAADQRSGSLHAASQALLAGIGVGVVPWGPMEANALGGHTLLDQGCRCIGSLEALRTWLSGLRPGADCAIGTAAPPRPRTQPRPMAPRGASPTLPGLAIDGGESGWQRYAAGRGVVGLRGGTATAHQPVAGPARQVLDAIERCGGDGCNLEILAARFDRAQVAAALLELNLEGHIHCDRFGNYRTTAWAETTR